LTAADDVNRDLVPCDTAKTERIQGRDGRFSSGERTRARRQHTDPCSAGQACARTAEGLRGLGRLLHPSCFDDARRYIPQVLSSRGDDLETGAAVLDQIRLLVQPVDEALYRDFEQLARERMVARDVEDWPIVAVALMLKTLVWTEDRDFFGSGIATWTTDRVELYLQGRHG
jgi:hypothetical protein